MKDIAFSSAICKDRTVLVFLVLHGSQEKIVKPREQKKSSSCAEKETANVSVDLCKGKEKRGSNSAREKSQRSQLIRRFCLLALWTERIGLETGRTVR